MMMGGPGWGYHYTPCNSGGNGGSLVRGGLAVAGVVVGGVWVLETAGVWLAVGAGVALVLAYPFARVVRWSRRLSVVTTSTVAVVARQDTAITPAPLRVRAVTRRASLEPPRRPLPAAPRVVTLTARDYVRKDPRERA